MQTQTRFSDDGSHWWDGFAWRLVSSDGRRLWDGSEWEPIPQAEPSYETEEIAETG
jgi:hypothetical protein